MAGECPDPIEAAAVRWLRRATLRCRTQTLDNALDLVGCVCFADLDAQETPRRFRVLKVVDQPFHAFGQPSLSTPKFFPLTFHPCLFGRVFLTFGSRSGANCLKLEAGSRGTSIEIRDFLLQPSEFSGLTLHGLLKRIPGVVDLFHPAPKYRVDHVKRLSEILGS
jgi:hypothetical protein